MKLTKSKIIHLIKTPRAFLLIGLFFLFSHTITKAQSIAYYPFNSVLGISSNPNNFFWVDMRLFTNSYFSTMSTDLALEFNIADTKRAYYYLGGGSKVNMYNLVNGKKPIEGYFVNGGVRARPFDKFKRVQVIFEISPYVVREGDMGLFRTMLGIGYNFNQRQ